MLGRYKMYRGKRPDDDPLPEGVRQDSRYKRENHCLRPTAELVERFLADPTDQAFEEFRAGYLAVLAERFAEDAAPFEELADRASREDVWIGCSCPTAKNPDIRHCHTYLALGFMQERFPDLEVVFPD